MAAASAYVLARVFELPTDLAVGLFAGALTSTPGLAAAIEALPEGSQVAVAYGIAYPIGVVGTVVFAVATFALGTFVATRRSVRNAT